jgi:ComF family protein
MHLLDTIVSLYAPHACVGCGEDGAALCGNCLRRLRPATDRCYACHVATKRGRTCRGCNLSGLLAVRSVARYDDAAKATVWALKFDRARAAAGCMAPAMAEAMRGGMCRGMLVVPAPTAASRARTRGYDQAALLARELAAYTGLTYAPLLMRLGNQRQVGASKSQRTSQLQDAFVMKRPQRVKGKHVLLVDDVVTTGSTLEAAARVLLATGAASVQAVTFAQA